MTDNVGVIISGKVCLSWNGDSSYSDVSGSLSLYGSNNHVAVAWCCVASSLENRIGLWDVIFLFSLNFTESTFE